MIICDTRERKNEHVLEYFERAGVPFRVAKLDTGDYMDEDRPGLTVDRKQNLDELAGNLFSPDKSRFWREVRRARSERKKLIILCEHGGKVRCLRDVPGWKSRFTKVTGKALYNEMCRCSIAYGVEFLFCDREHTGEKILELLRGGGEYHEG